MLADIPSGRQRLRLFSRIFKKSHSRWFAALEQSGLSAANFLFSLMVLRYAGVAMLGEYGFWFAISEFSTMFIAGFAVNQMALHVADSTVSKQREVMRITLVVVIVLQLIPSSVLWWAVSLRASNESVLSMAMPIIGYAVIYSVAELSRQFLYMRGRQRLSLFCAGISTSLAVATFAIAILAFKPTSVIVTAFWCLAASQLGYVLLASSATRVWKHTALPSKKQLAETVSFYWTNGRIAAAGIVVSWAQNKSVNPMLVLLIDSVAAGFYQLARMIIMPINMITAGIARSTYADLRRAWGDGDKQSLNNAIGIQLKTSMIVVFTYLFLVTIGFILVKLFEIKEVPGQLLIVFLAAAVVVVLSNYRYWMSHRLVVQLQFALLLKIGCIAAVITLLWMFVAGSLLNSASLLVLGSAIGELFWLIVLRRRFRQAY